jgi:hypothetical protein
MKTILKQIQLTLFAIGIIMLTVLLVIITVYSLNNGNVVIQGSEAIILIISLYLIVISGVAGLIPVIQSVYNKIKLKL